MALNLIRVGTRVVNLSRMTKADVDTERHAITLHIAGGAPEQFTSKEADELLAYLATASGSRWDERIATQAEPPAAGHDEPSTHALADLVAEW